MRLKNPFGASSALGTGKKRVAATISMAMIAGTFALVSAPAAGAATNTVYDATPSPLPPNVASLGFQATSTSEFGDLVKLGGTDRTLETVTVTMSDWALFSDYSSDNRYSGDDDNWTHPITLNVYDDALDGSGVPTTLLASTNEIVTIPWRPEAHPDCGTAWKAGNGSCYNGLAFDTTFDLGGLNVALPDEVIIGIAFNTQSYGSDPEGVGGPYDSLNVGVPSGQVATPGTDDDADSVFWNTSHAPFYDDGGAAGVGTFREDSNWTPNGTVAFAIVASTQDTLGNCLVSINGSSPTVYTLLDDCTTETTIVVPQHAGGTVFDGNDYSITGVDPVGGHFLGAVVQAAPGLEHMTVRNTTVQANVATGTGCDGGVNRLRGILFDGARGLIDNNVVTNIEQGANGDGCQEGNAIEVRNDTPVGPDKVVSITNNTVSEYQKTGIVANISVAATITNNVVTGDGPINYIAQNGIQVGFGATAVVKSNTSSGNNYTPKSDLACGFLIYQADGVRASGNTFFSNERNQCNFGKGGGSYEPSTP